MNTTLNFIFYAVILSIVLIMLDVAFLRLRKKKFEKGEPLISLTKEAIRRAREWVINIKINLTRPLPANALPPISQSVKAIEEPSIMDSTSQPESDTPLNAANYREQQVVTSEVPASENGISTMGKTVHIQIGADIPEGTVVYITIEAVNGEARTTVRHEISGVEAVGAEAVRQETLHPATVKSKPGAIQGKISQPSQFWSTLRQWFSARTDILKLETPSWDRILFVAAAVIYLLAVSIGIDRFPIYFFTDEAVHANLASEFVARGFTSSDGAIFPTYFSLGPSFGLNGVSVYLQVIPYILFGKSVIVTRMVSALITLLAAIIVGLLLKQVFKVKSYWLGILLLITSPAWFLHARTAFEYMEVAAFFAATLYFYNRYRQGEDKYLYATIFAAALTFYTHGLGQVLAGLTALLLFASDFRYHFQLERRRTLLIGLGLAFLFSLPYLRYNIINTTAITAQISQRSSYWMNGNFTFLDKVINLLKEYSRGINPLFWFFPNSIDIDRHVMRGYGNILWFMLPFALLGIIRAVIKFHEPEYRSVLIALLVAPIPATIVAVGTPRLLWMIVPWVILIALGLDWATEWITSKTGYIRFGYINLGLFIALAFTSIYILSDALVKGPTWYTDYGLYGMQYGAKQVFQDTVVPQLRKNPNINFIISPSWANGTDQFAAFFLPRDLSNRVQFGTPNDLINNPSQLTPNTIFILTPDEFTNFSNDQKLQDIKVREIIPYPNGKPGFYLVTLRYADNIDQLLIAEHNKERTPIEDTVTINEQVIRIIHSPIGGGRIIDTFDNNPDTLTRVAEANPYIFDLYPDPPLTTNSVVIQTGSLPDFTVTVSLYAPGANDPVTYTETFKGLPPDPLVTINFDKGPAKSARIYIEIKDNTSGDTSQIHVRTVQFK